MPKTQLFLSLFLLLFLVAIFIPLIIKYKSNSNPKNPKNPKPSLSAIKSSSSNLKLLLTDQDGNITTQSTDDFLSNYYTKADIDNNYYSKTDINNNYYTKNQTASDFFFKSDVEQNYYNRTQIDDNYVKLDNIYSIYTPDAFGTYDPNSRGYLYGSSDNYRVAWGGKANDTNSRKDQRLQFAIRKWPVPDSVVSTKNA